MSIHNPNYDIFIQVSGTDAFFFKTITAFKNVIRVENRGNGSGDIYLREVPEDAIQYRIRDIREFAKESPLFDGSRIIGSLDSAMVSTPKTAEQVEAELTEALAKA